MSIFAALLRGAYRLSGAKKAFGLSDFEAACKRAEVPYTAFARPKMVHCYCMLPCFRNSRSSEEMRREKP